MFDILVYLFENYVHADACPEPAQLARKLTAAGFEEGEISEALEWLSGLRELSDGGSPPLLAHAGSLRIYAPEEQQLLDIECRGFLQFLENAGILDAECREINIERALALGESEIELDNLKVIVLMVLWQQDKPINGLILDELLNDEDEDEDEVSPRFDLH
jgi:Smg protein